ncbi:MAG: SCP2 sterol-binding domain-containing protein [Actinobacteria bacterium]|nr:SCP2 sterol-binding domain-containing protein [Actinomycetota bacterium]
MARFLSQEWIDEVNTAARGAGPAVDARPGVRLVIQQVVAGGPEGDVRYAVRVAGGTVEVTMGEAPEADVVVTEDHETAVALSRGDLSPQAAFMTGRIRVSGDMAAVMANQGLLHELDRLFVNVRAGTTY